MMARRWITVALLVCLVPGSSLALSPSQLHSVIYDSVWYNPQAGASSSCNYGANSGSLSATVPAPYHDLFAQAAAKFNTDPAFLASIFYIEHGGNFPNPPPPYGTGKAWATSPAGASGPFQFIPGTWLSYKNSNPAGHSDVNDLTDASYAAAHKLADLGGVNGTPLGDVNNPHLKPSLVNAAASYNAGGAGDFSNKETQGYIHLLVRIYPTLVGAGGDTAAASGGCGNLDAVVQTALQELASGATEANNGYLKYTDGRHEEWCADFASWVYRQAGKPLTGGTGAGGWDHPSAYELETWIEHNGVYQSLNGSNVQPPQPGDLVFYHNGQGHVNIVVAVNGNSITVVGGNQSNAVTKYTIANYASSGGGISGWGTTK